MQRALNRHKGAVISINLSSRHFQRGDSAEVRRLQEDLQEANLLWTRACAGLQVWETGLQGALMECQVRAAVFCSLVAIYHVTTKVLD